MIACNLFIFCANNKQNKYHLAFSYWKYQLLLELLILQSYKGLEFWFNRFFFLFLFDIENMYDFGQQYIHNIIIHAIKAYF